MNTTENYSSTERKHGKKRAHGARSERSYTLYDTCDTCTVAIYEKITIDDDLRAIIKSGEPTGEQLVDAKIRLLTEFAELSGNKSMVSACNRMKAMNGYRVRIVVLAACLKQISNGITAEIKSCLTAHGVNITDTMTPDAISKKIRAKINSTAMLYKEEAKRAEKKAVTGTKTTRRDINTQLVVLSKHAGFRLTKEITLTEYAGYINDFNILKNLNYGKKH